MNGYRVGRIFGIDVRVHGSWLVIAVLIVWTLAAGALPASFPEMTVAGHVVLAAALALLFFASLLAHELAHSVVAEARGIPVRGITFFLFGGMAQAARDTRSPGEEFVIAIAGPVMSLLLGGVGLTVWWLGATSGWPAVVVVGALYTGGLNLMLAVFNMLPGFPMDGGRVLRAILWKLSGDVTHATRWASRVGVWMALALIVFGVHQAVTRDAIGGLWLVLIGFFIRSAARASYRQHVLSRVQELATQHWAAAGGAGMADGAPLREPFPGGTAGRHPGEDGAGEPDPWPLGRDVTGLGAGER